MRFYIETIEMLQLNYNKMFKILIWLVTWYRKYEHDDESYYNLFKGIVIEENPLFP